MFHHEKCGSFLHLFYEEIPGLNRSRVLFPLDQESYELGFFCGLFNSPEQFSKDKTIMYNRD